MFITIRAKLAEYKSKKNNTYWETVDYSQLKEMKVLEILTYKDISAKTVQQIIQTGKINFNIYMACQHELAQIEDILNLINRINEKHPDFTNKSTYNEIINYLFKTKRKNLNEYVKETYNVEVTSYTAVQIQEMLNLSFTNSNSLIDAHTHSYWETLDYSKENDSDIYDMASAEDISVKAIQRIMQTANFGLGAYVACRRDIAPIEDIISFIKRIEQTRKVKRHALTRLINETFSHKRKQVNIYINKTFKVNAENMTQKQIKEMLNIIH
jgi:hypothetical protein